MKRDRRLKMASLKLYEGQLARLRELHPRAGASEVVRLLIERYLKEMEEKREAMLDREPEPIE